MFFSSNFIVSVILYFCFLWLLWASWVIPVVENLPARAGNAGDLASIPGLGWGPGEGNGYPLQNSCLENPMDRGAWPATVPGVTKSQTWVSMCSLHCIYLLRMDPIFLLILWLGSLFFSSWYLEFHLFDCWDLMYAMNWIVCPPPKNSYTEVLT